MNNNKYHYIESSPSYLTNQQFNNEDNSNDVSTNRLYNNVNRNAYHQQISRVNRHRLKADGEKSASVYGKPSEESPIAEPEEPESVIKSKVKLLYQYGIIRNTLEMVLGIMRFLIFASTFVDLFFYMEIRMKYFKCSYKNIDDAYKANDPSKCNTQFSNFMNPALAVIRLLYELPASFFVLMSSMSIGGGTLGYLTYEDHVTFVAKMVKHGNLHGWIGFILIYCFLLFVIFSGNLYTPVSAKSKLPIPDFMSSKIIFLVAIFVTILSTMLTLIGRKFEKGKPQEGGKNSGCCGISNIAYLDSEEREALKIEDSHHSESATRQYPQAIVFFGLQTCFYASIFISLFFVIGYEELYLNSFVCLHIVFDIIFLFIITFLYVKICLNLRTNIAEKMIPTLIIITFFIFLSIVSVFLTPGPTKVIHRNAYTITIMVLWFVFNVINVVYFFLVSENISVQCKGTCQSLLRHALNNKVWIFILSFCGGCMMFMAACYSFGALWIEEEELDNSRFKFIVKYCSQIHNDPTLQKALVSFSGSSLITQFIFASNVPQISSLLFSIVALLILFWPRKSRIHHHSLLQFCIAIILFMSVNLFIVTAFDQVFRQKFIQKHMNIELVQDGFSYSAESYIFIIVTLIIFVATMLVDQRQFEEEKSSGNESSTSVSVNLNNIGYLVTYIIPFLMACGSLYLIILASHHKILPIQFKNLDRLENYELPKDSQSPDSGTCVASSHDLYRLTAGVELLKQKLKGSHLKSSIGAPTDLIGQGFERVVFFISPVFCCIFCTVGSVISQAQPTGFSRPRLVLLIFAFALPGFIYWILLIPMAHTFVASLPTPFIDLKMGSAYTCLFQSYILHIIICFFLLVESIGTSLSPKRPEGDAAEEIKRRKTAIENADSQ